MGEGAVEDELGGGPGAFEGAAGFFGGFVEDGGEVGEAGFGFVALAETPGGSDDFVGEDFFEEAVWVELVVEGFVEVGIERFGFCRHDFVSFCLVATCGVGVGKGRMGRFY